MLGLAVIVLIASFGCSSDQKTEEVRKAHNEKLKRGYGNLPIDRGGVRLPNIKK